ncbi:MAG: ABC transporter substrate-binding protein [Gammaproteobacteria bacterium]|nr:ABC transporter substrate-binding protein [Gammaproteobacteria bacterium]
MLLVLLSACATVPQPGEQAAMTTATAPLEIMAGQGRFLDAALGYSKLAADATSPQHEQYSLRAAELLMDGNYVPQAFQLLLEIDATALAPPLQIRHALLSADVALARQLPEQALSGAASVLPMLAGELPPLVQRRFHRIRAQAFAQQGNLLESARERVALENLLDDPDAILRNQQAILSALQTLSPQALVSLQGSESPDVFRGWLELAGIGQRVADASGDAELVEWRERYPRHPALGSIISDVIAARPLAIARPSQIALILPLKGRFAKAARAVRDGFLAAYYSQTEGPQTGDAQAKFLPSYDSLLPPTPADLGTPSVTVPTIRIYDEGDNPELIERVYQQAINDGAQFVVGPLSKEAVNHLAKQEQLPVPVLALNFTETPSSPPVKGEQLPPTNLFQLSLSPEQEARQLAERAWLDGHRRAAIITPDTGWGRRVARAFSERWLQLGGHVVEKQTYNPRKSDYSLPIRRLLNVDESQQRKRALRRTLGKKLEYIPRRRQDIDFIFMAAFSRQARLIRPQLRFHHAPKVPVYATSHSYSGSINADMDRDMDGVQFSDMPWTLSGSLPPVEDETRAEPRLKSIDERLHNNALKSEIEQLWPEAAKRYSRLYALGVDAYRVIGALNALRRNRTDYFRGETGDLQLDVANRLQRRLLWARFQRGVPQRINEYE